MRPVWLAVLVVSAGAAACRKSRSKPAAPSGATLELDGGAGASPRGPHVDAAVPPPRPDASLVDAALFDGRMPAQAGGDAGVAAGFDGHPGWLIVGDSFDRHGMALARAHDLRGLGVPASVVQTSLLSNLRPGLFVTVLGRFEDKGAAQTRAAELKDRVPKLYVKQSGALRSGANSDAGVGRALAALVRVHGTAKHDELPSPLLHVTLADGNFDTRPDADGQYELWVATPGDVSIQIDGRGETHFEEPCSSPKARAFWMGGSGEVSVDGAAADLVLEIDRHQESNPCD